jgi:hypothetical protein
MTRHRIIPAAFLAVVALGAVWWLLSDGLTAEERQLVGTWDYIAPPGEGTCTWEFGADRRFVWTTYAGPGRVGVTSVETAHWSLRAGMLIFDHELNSFRRTLRPVADRIGMDIERVETYPLASVTGPKMVTINPDGVHDDWTRDRGD